jgi:hypothetical protein
MAVRKVVDCRTMPSESNCSLVIIGEEEEVVRAAVMHAMDGPRAWANSWVGKWDPRIAD